jgi:hypothetical protein
VYGASFRPTVLGQFPAARRPAILAPPIRAPALARARSDGQCNQAWRALPASTRLAHFDSAFTRMPEPAVLQHKASTSCEVLTTLSDCLTPRSSLHTCRRVARLLNTAISTVQDGFDTQMRSALGALYPRPLLPGLALACYAAIQVGLPAKRQLPTNWHGGPGFTASRIASACRAPDLAVVVRPVGPLYHGAGCRLWVPATSAGALRCLPQPASRTQCRACLLPRRCPVAGRPERPAAAALAGRPQAT